MRKIFSFIVISLIAFGCKPSDKKANVFIKDDSVCVYPESEKIDVPVNVKQYPIDSLSIVFYQEDSIYQSLRLDSVKGVFLLNQYQKVINDGKDILKPNPSVSSLKSQMKSLLSKPILKYDEVLPSNIIYPEISNDAESFTILLVKIEDIRGRIERIESSNITLGQDLLHKKFIHTNANFYLKITINNPSQDKFLRGWMRRAFNQ